MSFSGHFDVVVVEDIVEVSFMAPDTNLFAYFCVNASVENDIPWSIRVHGQFSYRVRSITSLLSKFAATYLATTSTRDTCKEGKTSTYNVAAQNHIIYVGFIKRYWVHDRNSALVYQLEIQVLLGQRARLID